MHKSELEQFQDEKAILKCIDGYIGLISEGRRSEDSHNPVKVLEDLMSLAILQSDTSRLMKGYSGQQEEKNSVGNQYLQIIEQYQTDVQLLFPYLISVHQRHLFHYPCRDVFGKYYSGLIDFPQSGLIGTNEHSRHVVNGLTLIGENQEGRTVLDTNCGFGESFFKAVHKASTSKSNVFLGLNSEILPAKIAVVNLLSNSLNGEVVCVDPNTMEWFGGWQVNLNGPGVCPIEQTASLTLKHHPNVPNYPFSPGPD